MVDRSRDDLEQLLLGAPLRYTRDQFVVASDVELEEARRYWRALGFPNLADDDTALTDADLDALHRIRGLVLDGVLDEDVALRLVRAFGRTLGRLAEWQVESVVEVQLRKAAETGGAGVSVSTAYDAAERLLPELEVLLRYVWRRELAAAAARLLGAEDETLTAPRLAVGFADVAGYTRLSRRMEEVDLAALVDRFESLVGDVVAMGGGRLVKTVGDEALFVSDNPVSAAAIALQMLAETNSDPTLPRLRAGLASGPVVARMGDVYGTTVNRASRLTRIAPQGRLVVDADMAAALVDDPAFHVQDLGPHTLRGLGSLGVWLVDRAGR